MKRFGKPAFVVFVVLGAFFAASWCGSMLWSFRTADVINGVSRGDFGFGSGGFYVEYYETPISWIAFDSGIRWNPRPPRAWPRWRTSSTYVHVFTPLWLPAVGCFAGAALVRWRWSRAMRGCCRACGYDLRGVSSARCPECGRARSRKGAIEVASGG